MKNIFKNEDGATAIEYCLILALVVIVCVAAFSTLGNSSNGSLSNVATKAGTVM